MTESARCPCCGSPAPAAGGPGGAGDGALRSLQGELRRIREIAEARQAGETWQGAERHLAQRRIEELSREVSELRATVARLRGSAATGLAQSH